MTDHEARAREMAEEDYPRPEHPDHCTCSTCHHANVCRGAFVRGYRALLTERDAARRVLSMDDEARARDERAGRAVQRADDAIAAMAVDTWRSALLTAKVTIDSLVVMLRAELAGDMDHGLRMLNCAALVEAAKCIDEAVAVPAQAVLQALTERDAAREEMAAEIQDARALAWAGWDSREHVFDMHLGVVRRWYELEAERDALRQQLQAARDAAVRGRR